ncbi:MAG: Alginate biosynthesis protein AlgA [Candidatus Anoxychlamydiales bacterium]|nr:Alginate biosynthesis protein AlgA [Candidatus Anoxychlamydiales bacterium]
MKAIILAGGVGKRLWPISNKNLPKQFLKFLDQESLFQKTIKRFETCKSINEIVVVTNKNFETITKEQIEEINFKKKIKILLEPDKRNTAPAILFAIKTLKEKKMIEEREKLLFLPSDHLIFPKDKFLSYIERLSSFEKNKIVIFGIRPHKIETGYGYVKLGKKESKDLDLYKVDAFVEKPSFEKAKKFFLSENYLWNSGMFLFTEKTFKNEIKKHSPNLFEFYELSYDKFLKNFSKIEKKSIDYALIEKTKNILVQILDISWSDVGSWDSLYEVMPKDENENVVRGNVVTLDTKKSLIFSKKKLISTMGLDNIILVETEDTIFLAKKQKSQKVKDILKKILKKNNQK